MLDVAERSSLKHEFARRRRRYEEATIKQGLRDEYEAEKWHVVRKNMTSLRVRRDKSHDAAFEDDVWCTLYQLELEEMSVGRGFRIPAGKSIRAKQVDVFGYCPFGAILVECKSNENYSGRRLRKDLSEFVAIREHLRASIASHASRDLDVAIVFATRNVLWSKPDLQFAEEHGIVVWQDDAVDYYAALATHLGAAAQYQVFADLFKGEGRAAEEVHVAAIRGKIDGNEAFIFSATAGEILPISHIAHRARVDSKTVTAYQRMVQKNRLQSIRAHIAEHGALFPNAVILNFHADAKVKFTKNTSDQRGWDVGTLCLPREFRSAWVIDGQHRLMGLAGTPSAADAALPVVAFNGLDSSTQARIFVDINSKQVKVQNNLLEELYADLLWGSDDPIEQLAALCAKTVGLLDKDASSPLRAKIKGGTGVRAGDRPITITTLSTAIKKAQLYGHIPKGASSISPGPLLSLREPFMEESVRRGVECINRFLSHFATGAPEHWRLGDQTGGYLCTNNGLVALFILFRRVIHHVEKNAGISAIDWSPEELSNAVEPLIRPVVEFFAKASPGDIHQYRRLHGASGQSQAAFAMMALVQEDHADFAPPGLGEYLASQDDQYTDRARVVLPRLQVAINAALMRHLHDEFGEAEDEWWAKGIPQQVRLKVAQRREQDPERPRLDQSFDLLDYKAIVNSNWELLGEKFGIASDGKGKAKQLAWFQQLNELRNRVAHPERGQVSREELEWILSVARALEPTIGPVHGG